MPNEIRMGIAFQNFVELRITGVVGKLSCKMRKILNVHHDRNSHLGADGKWELAASLLESCRTRFARSESVAKAERLVYLKLMEKTQNMDPFKFILYSAKIGEQVPQMGDHAEGLRGRSANGP